MLSRGQVELAAREINALHGRIGETFRRRRQNHAEWEEWHQAAEAFHRYQNRIFLLEQPEVLARIRRGERLEVEGALTFLEVDPWFHRSGYLKEKVLRALKKAPWDERDVARLQALVLRVLEGRYRREFCHYSRLVPRLRSAEFDAALRDAASRALCSNHVRLILIALRVPA